MIAIVLVCDGCRTAMIGPEDQWHGEQILKHEAEASGWHSVGREQWYDRQARWYCRDCWIAKTREALVAAPPAPRTS